MITFSDYLLRDVIDAQKIGFTCFKFHHTLVYCLHANQLCICNEARRIAANIAKLPELLKRR